MTLPQYISFTFSSSLCLFSLFSLPGSCLAEIDFNQDIRPILSDKCISCHGPDEEHREADLRFDIEDSAKGDLGGYAAIVPGDPAASEMMSRIEMDDVDLRMPPPHAEKDLEEAEIELLKQWIEQGANWEAFWAYVPPEEAPLPGVSQSDWCHNQIDHFILAQLDEEGLKPSAPADRVTLLRRLYFDLVGLPPTPEQVQDFLNDDSPQAVEKVVDQLLSSPHFGEKMAMYWLDLVRYADTVGYHGDQDHSISPYRDWVINAFNQNMPYDQFTREQLAGDLLPNPTIQQKVATGYNRLLQTTHEGGLQQKEYLAIYAADRVRNLSAVWMGATMGCAQCHTHKYDPYTITDFYSMVSFFADIDEEKHFTSGSNALPTHREPEMDVYPEGQQELKEKLTAEREKLQQEIDELTETEKKAPKELEEKIKQLSEKLTQIEKLKRRTMITVAKEPREIRVLPRGNWLDDSGPIVEPAIPAFLGTIQTEQDRANRLDLANWLVDAEEGTGLLSARVFVNRLWYLMYGRGLADLTDFGGQGSPPTHPELLDQLALEFVASGWDIKHMLRLMALSNTYQQSSVADDELLKRDPENRLYARQSRFRLPAETVRDNALAVSGLLVHQTGGASVRPYQPEGYYRHLNFPKRKYVADNNSDQYRRGVYVHWQRQFLHPMLKAFDAPSREECTAQRPRSNTPLAALVLLNDPSFLEAAKAFAVRVVTSTADTEAEKIDFAFQQALSRRPDETEQQLFQSLLNEQKQQFAAADHNAAEFLQAGQFPTPAELDINELAAWTQVTRVLLNMNETMMRN